jgi:hypothetical protein
MKEIERHLGEVLGMKQTRSVAINWEELNSPAFNLAELDEKITGDEVSKVITDLPKKMLRALPAS